MKRMWINQPSKYQKLHDLHGTNVLSTLDTDKTCRIYFLSGDIVSMQVPKGVLSSGWKKVKVNDE